MLLIFIIKKIRRILKEYSVQIYFIQIAVKPMASAIGI